jgi:hypothetical protein
MELKESSSGTISGARDKYTSEQQDKQVEATPSSPQIHVQDRPNIHEVSNTTPLPCHYLLQITLCFLDRTMGSHLTGTL